MAEVAEGAVVQKDEAVEVTLARLEGKIDTNFATIRANLKVQADTTGDHETRLRQLEQDTPRAAEVARLEAGITELRTALAELNRWRWKLVGFFAAVSAAIAVATAVVTTIIQQSFHH